MYQKIGIMGALPQEIILIKKYLKYTRTEVYASVEYTIGSFNKHTVVLCCAGMGKVNAASCTQVLITKYKVEALAFNGIAGNVNAHLNIGDVVIGAELCYHDAQDDMLIQSAPFTTLYQSSLDLIHAYIKACSQTNTPYIVGKIATGDQFISDVMTKKYIVEKYAPDCVEMEGAAFAHVATRNDIPFIVVRAMSDNADTDIDIIRDEDFDLEKYANNAAHNTLKFLENI